MTDASEDKKRCVACDSEISANAKICVHCKRYQTAWKNLVIYFGSILGVLTFAISGLVFAYSKAEEMSGAKIDVLRLSTNKQLVVMNNGKAPGVLTRIDYIAALPDDLSSDAQEPLYEKVNAGEMKTIEIGDAKEGGETRKKHNLFLCSSDQSLKGMIKGVEEIKIKAIVYTKDDPEFEKLKDYYPNALEPACEVQIGVLGKRREKLKKVPCDALLVLQIAPDHEDYEKILEHTVNACTEGNS